MAVDLKGRQLEALCEALLSAFPTWNDVDALVEFVLSVRLEAIVGKGPLNQVVLDLVRWARQRSKIEALVEGALGQNPTNDSLKRVAYELSLSSDQAPGEAFEALVMASVPFENVALWRERMVASERRVCRIEIPDGQEWKGTGTGFLVSRDLVMTNHHVAQVVQQAGVGRAQFDYSVDEKGKPKLGRISRFAKSWLVHSSPSSELDFALVRLAESVGADAIEGAARGWLTLDRQALAPNQPLIVLQHPGAERLKIAVGAVTDASSAARIRYSTNTLPGSSGSPCFTMGWDLVALHQAGTENANTGIRASAILDALAATDRAGLLGAAEGTTMDVNDEGLPPRSRIFISYRRQGQEAEFSTRLHAALEAKGHFVFRDVTMSVGTDWAKEITRNIAEADAFVVIMSEESIAREMVQAEVREAHLRSRRTGKPRILPVRFNYDGPLDYEIDCYVGRLHYATWNKAADDSSVVEHVLRGIADRSPQPLVTTRASTVTVIDRPVPSTDPRSGGTMPPEEPMYIRREADDEVDTLAKRDDGQTLIVRGPRQCGKSSLLMRYLAQCQAREKRIAFIDFQMFGDELDEYPEFLGALATTIASELELDAPHVTTPTELLRFLRDMLKTGSVVLAFEEVDRVLGKSYQTNFFSMLRSWHNNRANVVHKQWRNLDLALVISTEPELLIQDGSHSPFNVGSRVRLGFFTREQCQELNTRYASRALPDEQVDEIYELLGGHPYLTRVAFHNAVNGTLDLRAAAEPFGPFGDHLRAMLNKLSSVPDVLGALQHIIAQRRTSDTDAIYRLRAAGLLRTDTDVPSPANLLYTRFFRVVK